MIYPASGPSYHEVFNIDTFTADITAEELSKNFDIHFTEEDGNGLGMINFAWIRFKGITVRVIEYKDSDEYIGTFFSFPDKTPNQSQLIEELCRELKIKVMWISPLI